MIARQHRFHGPTSLNFVYRHGSVVRNGFLALKFISNQRRTTYRAAVIVSRKVNKSAVNRNRIRRRLYEVIRSQEDSLIEPYDLILTVYSDQPLEMAADKLQRSVLDLLNQSGVIQEASKAKKLPHAIVKTQNKT